MQKFADGSTMHGGGVALAVAIDTTAEYLTFIYVLQTKQQI